MRYELKKRDGGWCIWNRETDSPAVVDGQWLTGLEMEEAYELIRLLNLYSH